MKIALACDHGAYELKEKIDRQIVVKKDRSGGSRVKIVT